MLYKTSKPLKLGKMVMANNSSSKKSQISKMKNPKWRLKSIVSKILNFTNILISKGLNIFARLTLTNDR